MSHESYRTETRVARLKGTAAAWARKKFSRVHQKGRKHFKRFMVRARRLHDVAVVRDAKEFYDIDIEDWRSDEESCKEE